MALEMEITNCFS